MFLLKITMNKQLQMTLPQCNGSTEHKELSFHEPEFQRAFKILKQNITMSYEDLNGNVITDFYDSIKLILFNTF